MISDEALKPIIKCSKLNSLSLAHCPMITTEGLKECIESLESKLIKLDISGNSQITDIVLDAIAIKHGKELMELNLNGLNQLSKLCIFKDKLTELRVVDFSWIRSMNDETFHELMISSRKLKIIKLFGCNLLSRYLLDKQWINSEDKIVTVLGNEFD